MGNIKYLLPPVQRYFKAALHIHTDISDGVLSPKDIRDAYKEKGFSVMCITDHNVIANHSELNQPDFLMLTGVECDSNSSQGRWSIFSKTYHLLFIAKRPDILWQPTVPWVKKEKAAPYLDLAEVEAWPRTYDVDAINAIIARGNEKGFLCCYNHPVWSLQSYPDYAPLEGLWAMEICNYGSVLSGLDENNGRIYNEMCQLGKRIVPLGTDDAHSVKEITGAWTMIGARELTYESVIAAMEKGDLYASTGPQIHSLTLEDNLLRITSSPVAQIRIESGDRWGKLIKAEDALLSEGQFDLTHWLEKTAGSKDPFLRITVTAPDGSYAATRAYWRDELI